jgi:hypothetical protein
MIDINSAAVKAIIAPMVQDPRPFKVQDGLISVKFGPDYKDPFEPIRTKEDVQRLNARTLKRLVQDPTTREILNQAMQFEDAKALTDFEKAQVDAETARQVEEAAAVQAAQQASAESENAEEVAKALLQAAAVEPVVSVAPSWSAEDEQNRSMGITTVRDSQGNITKFVTDYQVTDESGNSVGRPTHLEARNLSELLVKQREAHIQATRAFQRLKAQKLSFKTQQPQPKAPSDKEMLDSILKSPDPAAAVAEAKKVTEITPEMRVRKAEEDAESARVTYLFLTKHIHDFNNCEANTKLLGEYFQENNLVWTQDNLELAFEFLRDTNQLAPVPARVVPSVENTAPAPAAASAATAAPAAVTAVPAVPASPAVAATPATPARTENAPVRVESRPGVNSGIVPGSSNANRIVDVQTQNATGELTKREISKWDAKTLRDRMRDPAWRPKLEAIGIKVVDRFRQG